MLEHERRPGTTPRPQPAPEASSRPVVLELRGVHWSRHAGTPTEVEVLHGIDLRLHQGAFVAITGPSGSGKSALLSVAGLLERPSAGRLAVCGSETTTLGDADLVLLRRRCIGTVLQHHQLVTAYSALENVMLPLLDATGHTTREMQERAANLIERVGLAPWHHRRAGLLSLGQQQLLTIARALAFEPALLLADEPTGNLDTKGATGVLDLLRRLNREHGTTVLLATSQAGLAARCDATLPLAEGRFTT